MNAARPMVLADLDDTHRRAAQRLPRIFFDYIDGAVFSETTARRNIAEFQGIDLRQKVLQNVSHRGLAAPLLGHDRLMPLVLGPVGFTGRSTQNGEVKTARAVHSSGITYCLSSFAIASMAELRAATDGPLWFQLQVLKDRDLAASMIDAARHAGVEALRVTVDTPIGGLREKDIRNGFRSLTRVTPQLAVVLAQKLGWCWRVLRARILQIGNLAGRPEYCRNAREQATRLADHIDAAMTWADIDWIRDRWPGKLVVNG